MVAVTRVLPTVDALVASHIRDGMHVHCASTPSPTSRRTHPAGSMHLSHGDDASSARVCAPTGWKDAHLRSGERVVRAGMRANRLDGCASPVG